MQKGVIRLKKILPLLLVICIMSNILVGCGEKKDKVETTYINVATSFGAVDSAAKGYYRLLGEFKNKNKDIVVEDHSVKADDNWKASIRSRFETGQEPDVMHFFTGADVRGIINKGQVVSIETIRKEYPDYCTNISGKAFSYMKEFDGNTYAVPAQGIWEGLFCNTQLFEKYNVPMITDWKSLLYAIDVFSKNGVVPVAVGFSDTPNYWIEHSILAAGGVSKHKVNPKSESELPVEWKKGLGLLNELYKAGAFSEDSFDLKGDLAGNQFNAGQAAMLLEGSWLIRDKNLEPYISVVKFPSLDGIPKSDQGVIAGYTMGFYISKKAWDDPEKRKACVKYIKHMTQEKSIAELCIGGLPASPVETVYDKTRPLQEGVALTRDYTLELPIDSRLSKSAWEYLRSQIPDIVKGKADIDAVLKQVIKYNQDSNTKK